MEELKESVELLGMSYITLRMKVDLGLDLCLMLIKL